MRKFQKDPTEKPNLKPKMAKPATVPMASDVAERAKAKVEPETVQRVYHRTGMGRFVKGGLVRGCGAAIRGTGFMSEG